MSASSARPIPSTDAPIDPTPAASRSGRVDVRSVCAFVGITFGLTWALEIVAFGLFPSLREGFAPQVVMAVAMWMPALGSWLTCRFVTHQPWAARVGLRPAVPGRRIFATAALAVGLVVLAVALGMLGGALTRLAPVGWGALDAAAAAKPGVPPAPVLLAITIVQALVMPFLLNGLLALGEEIGWRGWLLPALLPLGRWRAVGLVGLVWGLWHAPLIVLIGYEYGPLEHPAVGVAMFTSLCIAAGSLLAWVRLRGVGILPCAVGHGAINAWAAVPLLLTSAGRTHGDLLGSTVGVCAVLGYALVGIGVWAASQHRTHRSH